MKARFDLRRELRIRHFDRRVEVYGKASEIAAATYQTGSTPPALDDVRRMYRELLLVGSRDVIRAFNRISDTSSDKLRRSGMTEEAITAMQSHVARDFVNAVRTDLYPEQRALSPEDIRFIEPKSPGALPP